MIVKKNEPLFKVLRNHAGTYYSGIKWPKRGQWTSKVERVKACDSGWHLTNLLSLYNWIPGGTGVTIWRAHGNGKSHGGSDKIAFQRAKLTVKLDTSIGTLKKLTLFGAKLITEAQGYEFSVSDVDNEYYYITSFSNVLRTMSCWMAQESGTRKSAARRWFKKLCRTWRISYEKAIGKV